MQEDLEENSIRNSRTHTEQHRLVLRACLLACTGEEESPSARNQCGVEGGRSQGGEDVMNDQVLSKARINAHRGVDGGRSQGDDGLNTDMGTRDTDGAEQRYNPRRRWRVWDIQFPAKVPLVR